MQTDKHYSTVAAEKNARLYQAVLEVWHVTRKADVTRTSCSLIQVLLRSGCNYLSRSRFNSGVNLGTVVTEFEADEMNLEQYGC